MNPELCSVVKVLGRMLIRRQLQQITPANYRSCSTSQVPSVNTVSSNSLEAVVSCVSNFMKREERQQTDLLLIHNPASEAVLNAFKMARISKIACTISHNYLHKQLKESKEKKVDSYHMNLLQFHKPGNETTSTKLLQEQQILSNAGSPNGLVILASFVSDKKNINAYTYLTNRVLTRDQSIGFHCLHNIDWFCLMSEANYKTLSKKFNIKEVRLHETFYKHKLCLKMTLEDSLTIFHNSSRRREPKKTGRTESKEEDESPGVSQSNVFLVHFTPKWRSLHNTSLEDREKYQTFTRLVHGNRRLIPALEKWVPGCGRELIQKGYGMADEIVGVSPSKFLTLYKEVIKLPEFEGSALQNALSERSTVSQKDWGYRSKLL